MSAQSDNLHAMLSDGHGKRKHAYPHHNQTESARAKKMFDLLVRLLFPQVKENLYKVKPNVINEVAVLIQAKRVLSCARKVRSSASSI